MAELVRGGNDNAVNEPESLDWSCRILHCNWNARTLNAAWLAASVLLALGQKPPATPR